VSMSRVDGFSDVVFGFALTLLVVSLEVPKTYAELHESLRGFLPFGISFALLMTVWFSHYKFFRRFGTHDTGTIAINATLLFVVLFYVYPLKFLFKESVFSSADSAPDSNLRELMMLFGVGFTAIYLLLGMLYWNGLRQSKAIGLSRLEQFLTRTYIVDRLVVGCVGLVSVAVAELLPERAAGRAGYVYLLILLVRPVMRRMHGRKLARFNALNLLTDSPIPAGSNAGKR